MDRAFLAFVMPRFLTIHTEEVSQRWTRALDAAVLFLGDTQVVTSVAIVVSGYIQLPCGLSVYHWVMIVDLAWFSALTHLAALTSLRHYFRRRPAMAVSRVILMGSTLVLLASALKHTGYVPQDGRIYTKSIARFQRFLSSPAACLLNQRRRLEVSKSLFNMDDDSSISADGGPPFNLALVTMSLIYLVIGYVIRVIRLSQSAGDTAERWLRVAPINFLCTKYSAAGGGAGWRIYFTRLRKGILLICITILEAVCEIANSMLWEVFWLAAALVWGTFRLLKHRKQSYLVDEDTWGFGQVLALLLTALPFWSLLSNLQENIRPPRAGQTPITLMRDIEGIGPLDSQSWFLSLVGFLFGTVLTVAGGTIYGFAVDPLLSKSSYAPYGQGSDTLHEIPGTMVLIYLVNFGCGLTVVALFTALALAFHFRFVGSDTISTWWRRRMAKWNPLSQRRARTWTWIVFTMLLLGIQVLVYFLVFLRSPDLVLGGSHDITQ